MFMRRPDPLGYQLRLCHALLQHLYVLVDLTESCPHLAKSVFLPDLFTYPLRKLGFARAHFLLELPNLARTLSRVTRQRIDPLRQISEDLPDPSQILLER